MKGIKVKLMEHSTRIPSLRTGFFAVLANVLRAKGSGAPKITGLPGRNGGRLGAASRVRMGGFGGGIRTATMAGIVCMIFMTLELGTGAALAAPQTPELKLTYHGMESATLVGTLNPSGGGEQGTYEFLYNEGSRCEGGLAVVGGFGFGFDEKVTLELSRKTEARLQRGTEYTVCLVSRNTLFEAATSAPVSFVTTSPSELPEAPQATAASKVSNSTATLEGVLNPHSSIPIRWFFEYNQGPSCSGPGATTTALEPPAELRLAEEEEEEGQPPVPRDHTVRVTASGLQRGTQYTYCLLARNGEGEQVSSNEVSFTTTTAGPTVGQESFSDVGSTSALLEASVDPHGTVTNYRFEYGTSTSYGASTQIESVGAAAQAISVQARLGALAPETTYHFRVVATTQAGETIEGADSTFSTYPPETLGLPDGREYEAVSSLEDGNVSAFEPEQATLVYQPGLEGSSKTRLPFRAAAGGEAFAYIAQPAPVGGNGLAQSGYGIQYLARRGSEGWSAGVIQPDGLQSPQYETFSSDLSLGILDSDEALTPGVPNHYHVLYASTTADGVMRPLFTAVPPGRTREPEDEFFTYKVIDDLPSVYSLAYAGASADMSHLLFEANGALPTEGVAPLEGGLEDDNLYDSVNSRLYLVNVLPGGEPAANATFGFSRSPSVSAAEGTTPDFENVISSDGSRIFWTDLGTGVLYVRENDTASEERCATPQPADAACTVQVSQGSSSAQYFTATPDGRLVTYSEGGALYQFDVETGKREAVTSVPYGATGSGELTAGSPEVTNVTTSGGTFAPGQPIYAPGIPPHTHISSVREHALVLGEAAQSSGTVSLAAGGAEVEGLLGAGENGNYLYFIAGAVLGGTQVKCSGFIQNTREEGCDLYVLHVGVGAPRFIATLSPTDSSGEALGVDDEPPPPGDGQPDVGVRTAYVTPDGMHLVFESKRSLTGFPSHEAEQIYMYDFSSGGLTCLSCNPRGAPEISTNNGGAELPVSWSDNFQRRDVSSDGNRVFFNTLEGLVPQDRNGKLDGYEWERDGTGSCTRAPGCVYLLTGGTSTDNSYFVDASENGNDVFLESRADLVPQDKGENFEIFDAHVCTSEAPCPHESTLSCTGTGCQGVPAAPPIFATPASATFAGVGNFPPPAPPSVLKPRPQTRAQRLAKALKDCRKDRDRRARASCERHARSKYGTKAKKVARRESK
jgi:hypothetical protein